MFNFLLSCVKKRKKHIHPIRKNANEIAEIEEITEKNIYNKEKYFVYNKKLKYKIKLDEKGKGLFKTRVELHKLFLEKRKNRKKKK